MFKEKYKIIIVLSFVFFVGSIIFSPQVLFAQKILAFSRTLPGETMEKMGPHFKAEAAKAWELYTKGILREMYFRTDRPESVLILECDNTDEAKKFLDDLPLVKAGFIDFDYFPLGPFVPLSALFSKEK